ncbi:hypothetical protein [Streptomyces niveus]|uniref:hypothetical protein n=1 Tax=Streptomyces niveus TaxID=193462 RepID=UPI0036D2EB51
MKPAPPSVLTNAFYAFYDLHRPTYQAYAALHLHPEEAQITVSHLFNLVADHWTTVVCERHPSAWAWARHTRAVARRSGRTLTEVEDACLLHDQLLLSIDQIATVTGTEPATVTALLAAARRAARPRPWTAMAKPKTSPETSWRNTHCPRTAAVSPVPDHATSASRSPRGDWTAANALPALASESACSPPRWG